ncbi:hypothetical protein Tco_1115014 [Tanacetum coccineum]
MMGFEWPPVMWKVSKASEGEDLRLIGKRVGNVLQQKTMAVRCFGTSFVVEETGSTVREEGVTGDEHRRSVVAVSYDQIRRQFKPPWKGQDVTIMDNSGRDHVVYGLVQGGGELRHRRHEKGFWLEVFANFEKEMGMTIQ